MTGIDKRKARAALANLPDETSYGEIPTLKRVYLPPSHRKAMDLNNAVVTGMRGSGKTFWWSALQRPEVRRLIGLSSVPVRSALNAKTEVRTGFGVKPSPKDYPSIDVLPRLMNRVGDGPRIVWRTVIARQLASNDHPLARSADWSEWVRWVDDNPEKVDNLFFKRDMNLDKNDGYFLILFDALDRCANDWKDMYRLIRGLLQNALEMRSYRRLRVKIFLRVDQVDKSRIGDFPDASKILSTALELSWPRSELYGLLWQLLANDDYGALFRGFLGGNWLPIDSDGAFQIPRDLVRDEEGQRRKFHQLSGPWMGTNPRRGFPFSWIPNHLGDTKQRVSPRSFIAALRLAAENTQENYPNHDHALHYNSINDGVRKASVIRVDEIREDYPWMHSVLNILEGLNVPCEFGDIRRRWGSKQVLKHLVAAAERGELKSLPHNIGRGSAGVREDLESAGVFDRLLDNRVNIPDIFRVGYGLGRKGGVKPVR